MALYASRLWTADLVCIIHPKSLWQRGHANISLGLLLWPARGRGNLAYGQIVPDWQDDGLQAVVSLIHGPLRLPGSVLCIR